MPRLKQHGGGDLPGPREVALPLELAAEARLQNGEFARHRRRRRGHGHAPPVGLDGLDVRQYIGVEIVALLDMRQAEVATDIEHLATSASGRGGHPQNQRVARFGAVALAQHHIGVFSHCAVRFIEDHQRKIG